MLKQYICRDGKEKLMKKVVVFDTAIGTTNLGDEIILQCLEEQMAFLLDNCFIMRFGTHMKNLPRERYVNGSQKIQFAYDADFKLIMGTNLLSRDIKKTQPQWPIGKLDSWLYDNCIMAGVGTTLSEGKVTRYSKKMYQRILRPDFCHSVRDEESKRLLEEAGFQAINTGCPTLWKITPEFCKQIPTQKASRVVFSLSGYKAQRNRKRDLDLIRILRDNYEELYFWSQTSADEPYLDTFEDVGDIHRICSMKKYKEILDAGDIDYVGTRLHGGVYALQRKVRSIIIAIDHRARGFHETNNLCICERDDIPEKLEDMINGALVTEIRLRQDDIDRWKAQFNQEYPKIPRKTHKDLLWVKAANLPFRTKKKWRKAKVKLKKKYKRWRRYVISRFRRGKRLFLRCIRGAKAFAVRFYIRHFYAGTMAQNPTEKGKILFFSFQGSYTCNPKYIAEEIRRRRLPWSLVWVTLKDPGQAAGEFPPGVKLVKFHTKAYYDELSRAQVWVDNAFNFPKGFVDKKKGQTYIQTMHGSLGLKKIGPDVVQDKRRNAKGFLCGALTDICISNSSFETMVYRTSFWQENLVEVLGHARNDIFFLPDSEVAKIKDKVCRYFGIAADVQLALYAPTFRKAAEEVLFEKIDFYRLRRALQKRFGGKWAVLGRAHHSGRKRAVASSLPYVLDASLYPDIQELMMAAEVGITDYSSWICDYVLRYKPGFLYTPDIENYKENRGFYYPLQETPFPICSSNDALEKSILGFDLERYRRATDQFLAARGCVDDGHASERIVDMIEGLVQASRPEG